MVCAARTRGALVLLNQLTPEKPRRESRAKGRRRVENGCGSYGVRYGDTLERRRNGARIGDARRE